MIKVPPVLVTKLFPTLNKELVTLLRSLNVEQWYAKTVCDGWCVKDIVQHLLKDNLGVISRKRDNFKNPFSAEKSFNDRAGLVSYINEKNQDWVEISRSFSPRLLIELLEFVGNLSQHYYESADLEKVEADVSWISRGKLPNWMDVAREYTEQWLHQAHIREAVAEPLLDLQEIFHPFIQTYMLALPKTYEDVDMAEGTRINIRVTGGAGGDWILTKTMGDWCLTEKSIAKESQASVIVDQDIVWRLFSKGISKTEVIGKVAITGDVRLGEKVLDTVSLIA